MTGPSLAMPLVALAVSLAVLAVGLRLRRAAAGRRVGDEPHCRACGYALVGIASDRCPECGADLEAPNAVARGRTEARTWLAWVAGFLLAAGFGLAVHSGAAVYRAVDWYRFKPTSWVLADLHASSANDAVRAALELRRRARAGSLSEKNRGRVADKALAEQVAWPRGPAAAELVDLLGAMAVAGKLPQEHRDRFFRPIVTAELQVRPKVLPGDPVPYRLRFRSNSPGTGWFTTIRLTSVAVDGKAEVIPDGRAGFSGLGSAGSLQSTVRCDRPGRHTLSVTARVRVMQGPRAVADVDDPAARAAHEADVVHTADTEVLDRQEPTVRRTADPTLAERVRASIRPRVFRIPDGLAGEVSVTSAPANLAFDVLARAGGREQSLGAVTVPRGGTTTTMLRAAPLDLPPGTSGVDLIFRPSDRAARGTVDMFEIWDGEVVVERAVDPDWASQRTPQP